MEVGIGGRYDSTNTVTRPVVCAVTSLGFDHIDILGATLPSIASHKGGIFKVGGSFCLFIQFVYKPFTSVCTTAKTCIDPCISSFIFHCLIVIRSVYDCDPA